MPLGSVAERWMTSRGVGGPGGTEEAAVPRTSAGLLMYRRRPDGLEVFLVHPGGPFWTRKDDGAWSIPKGELSTGEDPLRAARREFHEETGMHARGPFAALKPVKQPGGKIVLGWAFEGECVPEHVHSNTFRMEWPPGSGTEREFPEVDRADWFSLDAARRKILKGQRDLLRQLEDLIQA